MKHKEFCRLNNVENTAECDCGAKHTPRAKKRPYKVACRFIGTSPRGGQVFHPWLRYSSYATEKSRDAGLAQLRKSHPDMEFCKVWLD